MARLEALTSRQRALLEFSLRDFDARWDENAGLLWSEDDPGARHGTRESVYYALALLIRNGEGDAARAAAIIDRVNALQYLREGQPWHGTFPSFLENALPPETGFGPGPADRKEEYALDALTERLFTRYRLKMAGDGVPDGAAREEMERLRASFREVFPQVWDTYDPNWREFILCSYALALEFLEDRLPEETREGMDRAARAGVRSAVARAKSGVTPLNTNVWTVHILMCELFARRWGDGELFAYAEERAASMAEEYLRDGAVAEFNSPTYNAVVLTYTPFLKRCAGEKARALGETLDRGVWKDIADFYNPSLGNVCGPYSRSYEMDMRVHTALPMLMYLDGGLVPEDALPPRSFETESAAVMCLCPREVPGETRPLLLVSRGERTVKRTFRELCERGAPGEERTLCEATARIGDRLMYGCMSGSRNTSHQLTAAAAFWRNPAGGVSSFRLLRGDRDFRLVHLRTVFFDFTLEKGGMKGNVRNETGDRVWLAFEFESPSSPEMNVSDGEWIADGLRIGTRFTVGHPSRGTRKAEFTLSAAGGHTVRMISPLEDGETLRAELSLSLDGNG